MPWGQIAGAVLGAGLGYLGKKEDRKNQAAQNAALMAGFNQYKPYVDNNLKGSEAALDGVLNTGAYTGQTYAGPNAFQTGTANTMGNFGMGMMNSGNAMMGNNAGFGANANNMYGQYQNMVNNAQQQDRLGNAIDYANANTGSLLDTAMRDDRRNLQENTLTGIDLAASGSGNTNSSRAGIATAVANRGYDDRRADMASNIQNSLIDRSLNTQNQAFADQQNALSGAMGANAGIANAYTMGMNTLGEGANFGMNAGNALQGYNQAQLNDMRRRFEEQRDFELEQRKNYQAGILGKAPTTNNVHTANTVDPMGAAISGGMAGFGFMKQNPNMFGGGRTPNPHTR